MVRDHGKTVENNKLHGILVVYKFCIDLRASQILRRRGMLGTVALPHGAGQPKSKQPKSTVI
jgi:hypothetical protein